MPAFERRYILHLCAAAGLAVLGACSSPAPVGYPELTYTHEPVIQLNAARVETISKYVPPLKSPNVEHNSPIAPTAAVRRWAEQRLQAVGTENLARVVIQDASIVEVPLETSGGITGMFKTEQAARYQGRVSVMVEIVTPRGRQLAFVTANAEQSATVPEGASIAARERTLFQMTEKMMRDLDRTLEANIRRHFGSYVAR